MYVIGSIAWLMTCWVEFGSESRRLPSRAAGIDITDGRPLYSYVAIGTARIKPVAFLAVLAGGDTCTYKDLVHVASRI